MVSFETQFEENEKSYKRCSGYPLKLPLPPDVATPRQDALLKEERCHRPWMPLAGGLSECNICMVNPCHAVTCCRSMTSGIPVADLEEKPAEGCPTEYQGMRICSFCIDLIKRSSPEMPLRPHGRFRCASCFESEDPWILCSSPPPEPASPPSSAGGRGSGTSLARRSRSPAGSRGRGSGTSRGWGN